MFHGSVRYRASADSDDSYTSSSGEESLSDSPVRKSPARHEYDTTESRKVRLVRDALDTAYKSVAMIEAPREDLGQEGVTPWKDLGQALKTLMGNRSDARVRAALDVVTLSLPLILAIQHDIAPLGTNKQYTRSLSKEEARATYAVMKRWPDLYPHPQHMDTQQSSLSTPKWMLLELFRLSLAPADILSFADLPEGTMRDVQSLDLALACKLLKIPVESVLALDMTGNRITSTHIAEILSTFPLLELLGLSETFIRWFPVLILRHPIRHISGYFGECDKSLPLIRNTPKLAQQPRPSRHRSLIQYTLVALKRSSNLDARLLEMGLLPRIEELVLESYECELCDEMCAIRSEDWMEKQRLQWRTPSPRGEWMRVEGRLCRSCFVFLTDGTSSSDDSDSSRLDVLIRNSEFDISCRNKFS